MKNITDEIWQIVPGFPDYRCSSLGRIQSKVKHNEWTLMTLNGVGSHGYHSTSLRRGNRFTAHALIALTFLGEPKGRHINHINGIKTDNRLCNLEYVTQKENNLHALKTGLINNKGQNHGRTRFTDVQVIAIKEAFLHGFRSSNIARYFKSPPQTICNIRKGRAYKYLHL